MPFFSSVLVVWRFNLLSSGMFLSLCWVSARNETHTLSIWVTHLEMWEPRVRRESLTRILANYRHKLVKNEEGRRSFKMQDVSKKQQVSLWILFSLFLSPLDSIIHPLNEIETSCNSEEEEITWEKESRPFLRRSSLQMLSHFYLFFFFKHDFFSSCCCFAMYMQLVFWWLNLVWEAEFWRSLFLEKKSGRGRSTSSHAEKSWETSNIIIIFLLHDDHEKEPLTFRLTFH